MYEIFEQLLQKYGVTPYKVSKDTGVTQTALSNWKSGRSTPTTKTLQKIADYFGVTIDYLMTGSQESLQKNTSLSAKDERDISKKLDKIMEDMINQEDGPLYYEGKEIDSESLDLMRETMENALRQLKLINKVKYNPNKYKE